MPHKNLPAKLDSNSSRPRHQHDENMDKAPYNTLVFMSRAKYIYPPTPHDDVTF